LHALVRDNSHPLNQCLLEHLLAYGEPLAGSAPEPQAGEVRETVGSGVELGPWTLGRAGWRTLPCPAPTPGQCHLIDDTSRGPSDTEFARDGEILARFHFTDTARPDARVELGRLAERGFETFILSGDREEKVTALAAHLNLPPGHALGALTPQAKADWLNAHGADDALMLGDGANDSLAFDRALCRGTPVIHRGVLERKADFYYLGRGIGGLRALFEVDSIRRRTQMVILIFSVVYNLLAVGLAVAGRMNPLVAAVLMPINSILTLLLVTGGMRSAFRR
jgi:Cu2+-exporting ATPase